MFTSDGFDGQGNQTVSVIAANGEHIEQRFDLCFGYCRYVIEIFSVHVVYTFKATKSNTPLFYAPPFSGICKRINVYLLTFYLYIKM